MSNAIFGPSSNVKIGFRLSKCNIRPQFECQKRISSVNTRYSASIGVSKLGLEYHNAILGPSSNVKKKKFRISKCDIQPENEF